MATRPGSRRSAVELFAGVGGFALGLEGKSRGFSPDEGWRWDENGGSWRVTWANQWEPSSRQQHAAQCYRARFPETPLVAADIDVALNLELAEQEDRDPRDAVIRMLDHALEAHVPARGGQVARSRAASALVNGWTDAALPGHIDLLVGGFPCQDYSVAKTLKQASGIVGPKGVLWWQIERILRHRRPEHVILENVDRLLKSPTTGRGRDFAIMLATFAFHGYEVEWRVVNAAHYGLPQRRRRVFIYARPSRARRHSAAVPFAAHAEDVLSESGLFAQSFPCVIGDTQGVDDLLDGDNVKDPKRITDSWERRKTSPWGTVGFMRGGEVVAGSVASPSDDREPIHLFGDAYSLGDMLLDGRHVLKDSDLLEFLIPRRQLDFSGRPPKGTWNYLKGPKSDPRTAAGGFSYSYSEGGIAFPEPHGRAARTIVTGEGGSGPSRFKLVVSQPVPAELTGDDAPVEVRDAMLDCDGRPVVYRRLTPVELERLNMFPDGWTEPVGTATRRAFTMGNALVVGLVERLGDVLDQRIDAGL